LQFLSARTNKRTDNYGGTFENRSRIVFECLEEIKKRVPSDFLLSMKLNSCVSRRSLEALCRHASKSD
jgi:2,4-dienoyl-CoA reductase-like NADH-dependent reductase (Old Yellow Enzyme family)